VPRPWRLIDSGIATGALNMAIDGLLLERTATSESPVLRFYTWDPPAVSIGYNQTAATALDLVKCRQHGIDVVTRPSGGRAVLHWNELTYSLLWPENEPFAGGVSESCRRIGQCLVEGLRQFGVDAVLEPGDRPGSPPRASTAARQPCFASTSRWEVKCGGKKLIGSAQRRTRGGVLQHGSLLLGPEHLRLSELMRGGSTALPRTSTYLGHWVEQIDTGALTDCLVEGFVRTMGVSMEKTTLSSEETATARERAVPFSAVSPLPEPAGSSS
jgi:lipoate-protein ligase A